MVVPLYVLDKAAETHIVGERHSGGIRSRQTRHSPVHKEDGGADVCSSSRRPLSRVEARALGPGQVGAGHLLREEVGRAGVGR